MKSSLALASTDDNPPPAGAIVGSLQTPDSVTIRYARWKTGKSPCRGSFLLAQGRTEYIEKWHETVADLLRAGYDVCAFDWRGQGGSQRLLADARRGYVDHFDQYVLDLETVIRDGLLPDCRPPFGLLGHSTGSLVALVAAPVIANSIQRMVLGSPLIRFAQSGWSQDMLKYLSGTLTILGLGEVYMTGGPDMAARRRFSENVLTSDTRRFERNQDFAAAHPDLVIGGPTAAWVFAACRAMDLLADPDFLGSIHIPTLLIAAGNDQVVSNSAVERVGYALRSGRTVVIDGARHELLQERDVFRQQFLAAAQTFFPGG